MDIARVLVAAAVCMVSISDVEAILSRTFWNYHHRVVDDHHKNDAQLNQQLDNIITGFIEQPYDHFDLENGTEHHATIQQKYYVYADYWNQPDGPVFLYIGGESQLSKSQLMEGHSFEMVKKFGALLFGVEHRFYGSTEAVSMKQLQYLNSQQMLADLASFHGFATKQYGLTFKNKWVSLGGSYAGSLSAWFRLKYPHLVYASVASSAPVKAQVDFAGYNEVVTASFNNPDVGGSEQCTKSIRAAFQTVSVTPRQVLAKHFNTCGSIESENDFKVFLFFVAGLFMGTPAGNRIIDGRCEIDWACRNMTKSSDSYQNLVDFYEMNAFPPGECLNVNYTTFVDNWALSSWIYQTCQQFGYFQSCEKNTTCLFLPELGPDFRLGLCKIYFGFDESYVNNRIDFTNLYYGADRPAGARIIFVNGEIDPWHANGVINTLSKDEVAIFIKGASHCQDMAVSHETDSVYLNNGRKRIERQLSRWLKAPKSSILNQANQPDKWLNGVAADVSNQLL